MSRHNPKLRSSHGDGLLIWRILCVTLSCATLSQAGAAPSTLEGESANPASRLFRQHCHQCHSGESPKGDFQIADLANDRNSEAGRAAWMSVLDRLQEGDMPPEKEPRPDTQDLQSAIEWIRESLLSPAPDQSNGSGRVVLRRLNRSEYANTIRDLFQVDVDLTDLLPPDTSTSGFDNESALMHTSSHLLKLYLKAADRVLEAAIANGEKPWLLDRVFDIRKESSVRPKGSVYRHIDDGVAIFASWESANIRVTMWNFRSHVRGRYRVRISGYGYQSEGKPVDFHVTAGTFKEVTEERLIGYYSFPADQPTVLEFTESLEPENRLRIVADRLPARPPDVEKVGADRYTGPGLVIQSVHITGPLMESWPPPSHQALFGDLPRERVADQDGSRRFEVVSSQPEADARKILHSFARRAFRRPVTDQDIQPHLDRVLSRLQEGYSFEQATRVGLKGILVAPDFLFLRERTQQPGTGRLDDHALASRLSYFLWSSMPDETLFQLAETGTLHQPTVLREQVERMLEDPKAAAFTENFTGQWLSLRAIDDTSPDRTLYPEYDNILRSALIQEPRLLFREMIRNDLSLSHVVDSDFTFLNARLAEHYDIPGVEGAHMRKVSLPPKSPRGGFLTMGSVLKVTANGTTTSPVLRGAWLLDRILGTPPRNPPPDVGAIEPDIRGATTIRDQLAKHRNVEACASCHRKIDPPGFALESFDVIGGYRDRYRVLEGGSGRRMRYRPGPAVDAGDTLLDGRTFQDIEGYKRLLLEDPDQLARSMAAKLLAYATGATTTPVDQPEIEALVRAVRPKNHGLRSLIHEVVLSPLFQSK